MILKRIVTLLSVLGALLINQIAVAGSGLLFNVVATGIPANLSITLCLNGKGPLSCQNYTVSARNLSIKTTLPNHVYPAAGIKINTPGYSLAGCTLIGNGYCLFSVSSTAPASITVSKNGQTTLTSKSLLALSVNCPPTTPGCAYTNDALTGSSRQIKITNSGSIPAENVTFVSAGLPSGTTITSSTCSGTLAPGDFCTITIKPGISATSNCTAGRAPTNGTITVTADRASSTQVNVVVLSYSCIYQGGYVYSIDDTTPNTQSIKGKVTALSDQVVPGAPGVLWSSDSSGNYDNGVSIWGIDASSTQSTPSPDGNSFDPATLYTGQLNCHGATDGSCNTNNIYVYYKTIVSSPPPVTAYAAGRCKQIINGYSDWYLPAICEMGPDDGVAVCSSPPLLQLEQNMVDNLPILIDGCTGTKCLSGFYWSSTEHTGNPIDIVWSECFASGGGSTQCLESKGELLGVRCSRVLTFLDDVGS